MTGLAAVLAGRHDAGVYAWHAAFDPEDVRHTVEHAGWRFGYVDGWHAQTKAELLVAIGLALGFPDHYGANLDALNDCLRDLTGPAVLLWDGWSTLARDDERTFTAVVQILGDHTGTLTSLLRGEGPDVGLASLD
jgi:RNAse (barnase) inhibitor barstar